MMISSAGATFSTRLGFLEAMTVKILSPFLFLIEKMIRKNFYDSLAMNL